MFEEIKQLLENLSLTDEYKSDLSVSYNTRNNKDLLIICLDNNRYDLTSFFDYSLWDNELTKRVENHLKEYCTNRSYMQNLPEPFYNNPTILEEGISFLEKNTLQKFTSNAWNENNILKSFDNIKNEYDYLSYFEKNPFALKLIFKHKKYELLKFVKPIKEVWTEENINLYVDAIKENPSLAENIRYKSPFMLKRFLEEEMLIFDTIYWDNKDWTEENIDLLCGLFDKELLTDYNKYLYKFNKKMSTIALKKKRVDLIIHIEKDSWTEENIELFFDLIEEYDKLHNFVPTPLKSNAIVLKKYLELQLNSLHRFDEDAWTDENIKYYYDNYTLTGNFDSAHEMLKSQKCAMKTIKIGYIENLRYFQFTETNDELTKKICDTYKTYKPKTIPYNPCCRNKKLLRALIENNQLDIASRFNFQHLWDDELIDLYCQKLNSYTGPIDLKSQYMYTSTENSGAKLLKTYINKKMFEAISEISNSKNDIWTEENKQQFLTIIEEYLEKYQLPKALYDDINILNYYLEHKKYSNLIYFNTSTWNKELYVKHINLYMKGEFDKNVLMARKYNCNNDPTYKYLYYTIEKSNTSFKEDYKKYEEILKSDKLNNYYKFIKNTKSFSIYLYINMLANENKEDLETYFDENGLKEGIKEKLIFNKEYREFCKENDIDFISNLNNRVLLNYIRYLEKYPNLDQFIYIDHDNIETYFDELGPTIELYHFLFNPRGVELLYKLDEENQKLDPIRREVCKKSLEIESNTIRYKFIEYCSNNIDKLSFSKINDVYLVLNRIENSNSSEILHFKESLADQVLQFDNPDEKLEEVEKIFIKNNLPNVGKIFLVFKTLHPTYYTLINNNTSPTLKNVNDFQKDTIIFSDLIRITIGSNNKDFNSYMDLLVEGNKLYRNIKSGIKNVDDLTQKEKEQLRKFMINIEVLYNNTFNGSKNKKANTNSIYDLDEIKRLLNPRQSEEYELPDRMIYMFCHAAGFDNIADIKKYQRKLIKEREAYHKTLAKNNDFILKENDLVKGINNVKYLRNILQNGGLCKEFLGDCAESDLTPLDADVSTIKENYNNNEKALSNTLASSYGSTYIVFKNDNRFTTTRGETNEETPSNRKNHNMELFRTGSLGNTHYGIRTGFASSEIDYIITKENPTSICLDIAMSGIYIPVADINGKLIFSFDDYTNLRKKMEGLSYYGEEKYQIAQSVVRKDVEDIVESLSTNEKDTKNKRNLIIDAIRKNITMKIKTEMDGDLSPNSIEIIDTGSTGRDTNVAGDADFDFIVRIDRQIMTHKEKLNKLKEAIASALGRTYTSGDFRFQEVQIPNLDTPVDIDMTFITKTNKVDYSTEMCIKDRLKSIKEQYPDKYDYILANIILAKKLFKKYGCYKPKHARKNPEGGLGGVGTENWILQHGGSLIEAAKDFLNKSNGKNLQEFQNTYPINDFGANHMAERHGNYPFDNYIFNLNDSGYKKMQEALNDYILGKVNFDEKEHQTTTLKV